MCLADTSITFCASPLTESETSIYNAKYYLKKWNNKDDLSGSATSTLILFLLSTVSQTV